MPGPRPTAILLHGHPGFTVVARGAATNILELAQPPQRAGFNVLAFNYRGANRGSEGRYSIVGRFEDVAAAVTFVKSLAGRFNSDPARLMVVGHSMGGWNALVASVEDRNLNCTVGIAPASYGARRVERIRQGTEPAGVSDPQIGLSGYTGRQQRQEIFANQPLFDVAARMAPLKGRPLLIVQARQDETVPADEVGEYVDTARAVGVAPFNHVFVDADHNFTLEGNRKELGIDGHELDGQILNK